MHQRADRADRHLEHVGYLFVFQMLEVSQDQHRTVFLIQPLERAQQYRGVLAAIEHLFGIGLVGGSQFYERFRLGHQVAFGSYFPLPIPADRFVVRDAVGPGRKG